MTAPQSAQPDGTPAASIALGILAALWVIGAIFGLTKLWPDGIEPDPAEYGPALTVAFLGALGATTAVTGAAVVWQVSRRRSS